MFVPVVHGAFLLAGVSIEARAVSPSSVPVTSRNAPDNPVSVVLGSNEYMLSVRLLPGWQCAAFHAGRQVAAGTSVRCWLVLIACWTAKMCWIGLLVTFLPGFPLCWAASPQGAFESYTTPSTTTSAILLQQHLCDLTTPVTTRHCLCGDEWMMLETQMLLGTRG